MKLRVIRKPRAKEDLIAHFEYISLDKMGPAQRFLEVAEQAFERIAAMPSIGHRHESPLPHLQGLRVYPMPEGFRNYLICYRQVGDTIDIVRVLHGARDLDRILDRLRFD